MKPFIIICIAFLSLSSCNLGPEEIVYGTDGCHYCNMTIVDRQHASQIVTTKGKAFKFDAIECMVHSLKEEVDPATVKLYLINNFENPGELIDATTATYLVSKNIPSPMGAYLSGFEDVDTAEETMDKHQGELYNWKEIQSYLNVE